jgi:hypothetical protein
MLRKHPKNYCVRVTVYTPDPFRGSTHSSVSLTGVIPESLAEFLKAVMPLGGVPANLEPDLKRLTKKLKKK